MLLPGGNFHRRRTWKLMFGIFMAFSFVYCLIENHKLRAKNQAIIDGRVVHIVSLQGITSLRRRNESNRRNILTDRSANTRSTSSAKGDDPTDREFLDNGLHMRTTAKARQADYASLLRTSSMPGATIPPHRPTKSAQPEIQSRDRNAKRTTPAEAQPSTKSFFHSVSKLNPARDLQLVETGLLNFPHNMLLWQKNMQALYWKLFTRENVTFEHYYLNATLSESIPILRDIPDIRPPLCQEQVVRTENLPKVSIIIPFHNEQYSLLVRTLHSILDKTPASLLHEIILIDDASDEKNLLDAFPHYVSELPKVQLYRSKRRQGLIRARLLGAMMASAPVLVFLDAHIECQQYWLQPLLHIVTANSSSIAIPATAIIDTHTMKLPKIAMDHKGDSRSISGIFDWELNYVWTVDGYADSNQSPLLPVPTATIIGCAMAVNRDYFFHLGAFDEDMIIWGGENLEISFRTWMCGGSIQVAPCSIVSHVFRQYLPYTFPHKDQVRMNLQRVADVWMDQYASIYYQVAHKPIVLSQNKLETLAQRRTLRSQLQCRSFKWYLENVAKKVIAPRPNGVHFGQLRSGDGCLTLLPGDLGMYSCVYHLPMQHFTLASDGLLQAHNNSCLQYDIKTKTVHFSECTKTRWTTWKFDGRKEVAGRLYLAAFPKQCLEYVETTTPGNDNQYPHYSPVIHNCEGDDREYLTWVFTHTVIS